MNRLFAFGCALGLLGASIVAAAPPGGLLLLGAGTPPSVAASYSGAGDIIASGWLAAFDTQAFTAATRGNALMNVCLAADAACGDLASDATTGLLAIGTSIGGLGVCNTVTCTVKTWYDQSGNGIDVTQATEANRPVLVVGPNGLYCPSVTGTTQILASSATITQAQPFTIVALGVRTSDTTTTANLIFSQTAGTGAIGPVNSGNTWRAFAGTGLNGTASDSAFHSGMAMFNGVSSALYIDGASAGAGNAGAGAPSSSTVAIFQGTVVDRKVCEAGIISGDNTANASALYNNQKSSGRFGTFP